MPGIENPHIADLEIGRRDANGYEVTDILARKPPDYAVYRTAQRVLIQYADDDAKASEQRKEMASLGPLRGEINGLIDGWRFKPESSAPRRRAERYDRRVNDALVIAFEDSVADGASLLKQIKQDVVDERTASARLLYLLVALGACGIVFASTALLSLWWAQLTPAGRDLLRGAVAGAIGAFFSIALGMRNRTVLPDLQWVANAIDAALRVLIGVIAAPILVGLVDVHAVTIGLGDELTAVSALGAPATANEPWLHIMLIGLLAGFSERFVPDLLAKAVATPQAPQTPMTDKAANAAVPQPAVNGAQPAASQAKGASPQPTDANPEQASDDDCAEGAPLADSEATADADLPPATGGVEACRKPSRSPA